MLHFMCLQIKGWIDNWNGPSGLYIAVRIFCALWCKVIIAVNYMVKISVKIFL